MKCEKGLTFEECELAILRHSVDKIEKKTGRKMIGNPVVQEIIAVVEKFLIKTQRVCYGDLLNYPIMIFSLQNL